MVGSSIFIIYTHCCGVVLMHHNPTEINTVATMKEKILDILEKHYHGRNHIESRCADELLGLFGVGKRFCTCAEPKYNYPEMLWCDCCGGMIDDKVRIKLDEGSASVQRYVSGDTKNALNEMAKRVRKIFES